MVELPPMPEAVRTTLPAEVVASIAALEAVAATVPTPQTQVTALQARIGALEARMVAPLRTSPTTISPSPARRVGRRKTINRSDFEIGTPTRVSVLSTARRGACDNCPAPP
jgi:hypothetical protein